MRFYKHVIRANRQSNFTPPQLDVKVGDFFYKNELTFCFYLNSSDLSIFHGGVKHDYLKKIT